MLPTRPWQESGAIGPGDSSAAADVEAQALVALKALHLDHLQLAEIDNLEAFDQVGGRREPACLGLGPAAARGARRRGHLVYPSVRFNRPTDQPTSLHLTSKPTPTARTCNPQVKELYLQSNALVAIDNLDFLTNLEILALNRNSIGRVEGLAHLSKLQVRQKRRV